MTNEQRDDLLLSMATKIDKIDDKVNNLEEKIVKLSYEVKKNTAQIEKHTVQIEQNTAELARQRENIAHLEFTLTNKINALFDAREISLDKFKEFKKKFESINKILDNHNARIFKLETSKN